MIRNQRRPYIQSSQPEPASITAANISGMNEESLKALIVDSLKALNKNIDDLRQSVKVLEERFDYLDTRQRKVEADTEKSTAKLRTADIDLLNMRNDLEALKKESVHNSYSYEARANMDVPIMPGAGFACVTPNFLKNRQGK